MAPLTVQQLNELFAKRAALNRHEMFFDSNVALQYVDACYANDIAVIGIDGFGYDGVSLVPRLDLIADYSDPWDDSWEERLHRRRDAARRFLTEFAATGVLFTFVVVGRENSGGVG